MAIHTLLVLTTVLQCIKTSKMYAPSGFEPGVFCSVRTRWPLCHAARTSGTNIVIFWQFLLKLEPTLTMCNYFSCFNSYHISCLELVYLHNVSANKVFSV
jgi:hypothetical protein